MTQGLPVISLLGERAILIEFTPVINEKTLEIVLFYKKLLSKKYIKENIEVTTAYSSLLITYHKGIEDVYSEVIALKRLFDGAKITKIENYKTFHIPVCYEGEFAPDMQLVCDHTNHTPTQIISLHTQRFYKVYFIGFLPGFLYLGGLDKNLIIARKEQPRLSVKKGAVGIGGNQTGIYPKSSPGGWQIIGNSPVPLFNKNLIPPCEISAGDSVKFYSVSMDGYFEIQEEVAKGNFQFNIDLHG